MRQPPRAGCPLPCWGSPRSSVLTAYGTPIQATVLFATYLILGVTVPGTLWVRFLRGGPRHIAEDLALGLLLGYAVEIATYLVARAIGAPYLFLVWPIATIAGFLAIARLRVCWRGDGTRAPIWWSWSLAAMLAFLLAFSAVTFFASHPLVGGATPYLDMTYHLALVGELRHHVPPAIPYVIDVPLAYHWFFYADAAATSWATGIEPITLLYRLSLLPMFVAFVVLTASAARRLSTGWWTGPLAVAIALFGTVAGPHGWTAGPVFDSETLNVTWISPTNMFGLAIFAGVLLTFIDALRDDAVVTRRSWLLIAILVAAAAGAKASILPVLIVGLLVVAIGVARAAAASGSDRGDRPGPRGRRIDPGHDPALPRDDGWPDDRLRIAPLAAGRPPGRPRRRPDASHPAAHRPGGRARALVVVVGRRLRPARASPMDRGSSDPPAARCVRGCHRRGGPVQLSGRQPDLLPQGRGGGVRPARRDRDRRAGAGARSRTGRWPDAWHSRWSPAP